MSSDHSEKLKRLVNTARTDLSDDNIQSLLDYIWGEVDKDIPKLSTKEILSGKKIVRDKNFPWKSYHIVGHTTYLAGFGNFGVPFEEWKELASKALDLLEEQLEKPMTPMEDLDGYKDIREMGREMSKRFSDDPRFREAFRDPLSR